MKASIACLESGVFTAEASEIAVASRGVIAASASLRPSLKHISQRIRDADDRGANKIFGPVMQMVERVSVLLILLMVFMGYTYALILPYFMSLPHAIATSKIRGRCSRY